MLFHECFFVKTIKKLFRFDLGLVSRQSFKVFNGLEDVFFTLDFAVQKQYLVFIFVILLGAVVRFLL